MFTDDKNILLPNGKVCQAIHQSTRNRNAQNPEIKIRVYCDEAKMIHKQMHESIFSGHMPPLFVTRNDVTQYVATYRIQMVWFNWFLGTTLNAVDLLFEAEANAVQLIEDGKFNVRVIKDCYGSHTDYALYLILL